MTSPLQNCSGLVLPSTLMPGSAPVSAMIFASGVPSFAFWRSVSSNRMTPEIAVFIASVERNSISR